MGNPNKVDVLYRNMNNSQSTNSEGNIGKKIIVKVKCPKFTLYLKIQA